MRNRLILIFFLFAVPTAVVAQSDPQEHLQACKQIMGVTQIPTIHCSDGLPLETMMFGHACDSKSFLPQHGCAAGSRLGRIPFSDSGISGVFICRKYQTHLAQPQMGVTTSNNMYSDVGVILHKESTGETCFFNSDTRWRLDGDVTESELAGTRWQSPSTTPCVICHRNDAFLVTPFVAKEFRQLGLARAQRLGPYIPIMDTTAPSRDSSTCASACHYLPHEGASELFDDYLIPDALLKAWMPSHSNGFWNGSLLIDEDSEHYSYDYFSNGGSNPWIHRSSGTPSSSTGPSGAADGSGYRYMETSAGYADASGDTAILTSEIFYNDNAQLTFKYHMAGANVGSLYVDVQLAPNYWVNGIWSKTGPQQNWPDTNWKQATIGLSSYNPGGMIRIRFRAEAAGGPYGDIGIDSIVVSKQ